MWRGVSWSWRRRWGWEGRERGTVPPLGRREVAKEDDDPADPTECEKGNLQEKATENALSSRPKSTKSRISSSLPLHETWTETRYKSTLLGTILYSLVVRYFPGSWDVTEGSTIGSWLNKAYAHRGLSKEEALGGDGTECAGFHSGIFQAVLPVSEFYGWDL
mmetsp:Transcript_3722/g.7896  ORF Transcript_3722/g.7896 Transcript_3722/m.7896 type:complete len:162 (+) Transcript_3722:1122-1607(+)